MIQALRFKGRLLIPVASTGIAALLLEKGVTAHKCDIIFWDEITMSPFSIIGGVDNLMRKAKGVPNKPFGGWVCGCLFWEF